MSTLQLRQVKERALDRLPTATATFRNSGAYQASGGRVQKYNSMSAEP